MTRTPAAEQGRAGARIPGGPRAEILVVGTELLAGASDANGPFLSGLLHRRGLAVHGVRILPDDRAVLAREMSAALAAADLVLVTGGLGPTPDDVTREAACDATGRTAIEDPEARRRIEEAHAARGRAAPAPSLRQALLPEGARPIANVTGFAVGAVLATGSSVLVLLPGPPGELQPMAPAALDAAAEFLAAQGAPPAEPWPAATLVLAGIGESDAVARASRVPELAAIASVGWLARPGEVRLVLADPDREALGRAIAAASAHMGSDLVSATGLPCVEVVLAVLRERGETLAVAESCTGGLLAQQVTAIAGCSDVFRAGLVTYSDDAKMLLLGVPAELLLAHGAVSAEVAAAMASGARRAGRADFGIGITGIAGPGGATAEKPVGLVHWAVAAPDGRTVAASATFPGSRDDVRLRAAAAAFDALRRRLLGLL